MPKLTDDNFFNFQGKMVNKVVTNQVAWNIPAAKVAALTTRRAAYEPLYHKTQDKNTRTNQTITRG
jgi:hypothetical protein